jgi:hypothetical protein
MVPSWVGHSIVWTQHHVRSHARLCPRPIMCGGVHHVQLPQVSHTCTCWWSSCCRKVSHRQKMHKNVIPIYNVFMLQKNLKPFKAAKLSPIILRLGQGKCNTIIYSCLCGSLLESVQDRKGEIRYHFRQYSVCLQS